MKILLCLCLVLPVFAQIESEQSRPADQSSSEQSTTGQSTTGQSTPGQAATDQAPTGQAPTSQKANRSVTQPKPGGQVIKQKDLYDSTGYLHPFRRMPKYILSDQKAIWTSPFHTSKKNVKWWVIFGAGTGALIATDKYVSKNAPNPHWLQTLGSDVSYLGDPYTLIPIGAAFYFGGTASGHDHLREAGLLSFEALSDVTIMELALKSAFDRQRPFEGHGNGEFWSSSSPRYNSSFPSGHAIETFAMASIFAHEYRHTLWIKILAYGYAGGVMGARLAANKHFPGDVLAGGAMGWFVGDYVYGKRHNTDLDGKSSFTQKILGHVRIGGAYPTVPAY
jgi:membrane-associated phospholipid phosphatase